MSTRTHTIVVGINDLFVGGAQRLVIDVLKQPIFSDTEVHLVTFLEDVSRENFRAQLPVHVHYHHIPFPHHLSPIGWWRLGRLIARVRPQAVWTHFFFSNTVYRILQPFFGYRVVAVEHNTYTWKRWTHRLVDRALAHVTYRIVAVSRTVAEFTARQERISIEKFEVIPNGVNVADIKARVADLSREDALRSIKLPTDRRYVLNVARLSKQKNQMLLIEAFALFARNHPQHTLLIVGEGPERAHLQQQINELGLAGCVLLLGTQMNVVPYYRASDFFVLTSSIEGFALVCIEAMACGLPVIATPVAGPDEYIREGENGFLVSPDPEAISGKMVELAALSSETLQIWGDVARETAGEYSVEETARRYYELLVNKKLSGHS